MGAQRVLVVANRERTARILVGQFKAFFGDRVAVEGRSLEHGLGERPEGALVVTSTPLMTSRLGDWLLPGTAVVTAVRTLRRQAWEEVMALPARTAALVVNDGPDTAVDTVALLRELGAVHLALTPVYPGMSEVPRVQLAITPGEPHLVPPWVERVLDLGDRVLDPATILEVLTLLGKPGASASAATRPGGSAGRRTSSTWPCSSLLLQRPRPVAGPPEPPGGAFPSAPVLTGTRFVLRLPYQGCPPPMVTGEGIG